MGAVMGKLDDAVLVYDKRSREHPGVTGGFTLNMPIRGRAQRRLIHAQVHNARQTELLQPIRGIRFFVQINMAVDMRGQFTTKMPGVFRFAQANGLQTQPGRRNFFVRLLQLSQPFATENSAKVTQEG